MSRLPGPVSEGEAGSPFNASELLMLAFTALRRRFGAGTLPSGGAPRPEERSAMRSEVSLLHSRPIAPRAAR